jgi:glycosyltransferase involved in cell wall biosynthesis
MRVGIDARELAGHPTGVGRYLGALAREWAADPQAQQHEFVLYTPEVLDIGLDSRRFARRVIGGFPGTLWEQIQIPRAARRDRLDVFFAPAYTAPLRFTIPTVVTIHDLSFDAHPEWFRLREGARRRLVTRQSAKRAAAVIAVSEFSRREVIDRLGVPENRVTVVRSGIDPPSLPANTAPGAPERAKAGRLLYVGSIFNRRHVPELIRAFALVARDHPDASLDIVGSNRTHPHENSLAMVEAAGLNGRVRLQQYAQESLLRELYA